MQTSCRILFVSIYPGEGIPTCHSGAFSGPVYSSRPCPVLFRPVSVPFRPASASSRLRPLCLSRFIPSRLVLSGPFQFVLSRPFHPAPSRFVWPLSVRPVSSVSPRPVPFCLAPSRPVLTGPVPSRSWPDLSGGGAHIIYGEVLSCSEAD